MTQIGFWSTNRCKECKNRLFRKVYTKSKCLKKDFYKKIKRIWKIYTWYNIVTRRERGTWNPPSNQCPLYPWQVGSWNVGIASYRSPSEELDGQTKRIWLREIWIRFHRSYTSDGKGVNWIRITSLHSSAGLRMCYDYCT